jgi:hypothetical protein
LSASGGARVTIGVTVITQSTLRESYPAARFVAPKVHAHFSSHISALPNGSGVRAQLPDVDVIEQIITATFWASLRREEGYVPKVSLAYLPPEDDPQAMRLERPLPLAPAALAKVAAIAERPGIHLGVWGGEDGLEIWGTTRAIPAACFVLELVSSGLLVVKHHRGDVFGKYVNVAVLEGDEVKVVDEGASSIPDCPALLTSLLGFETPSVAGSINVLIQLAVSMRAHRRGGTLLVVPSAGDAWRESIVQPMLHAVSPPYRALSILLGERPERPSARWNAELADAVEAVARLTAVDGATVLTDTYELVAFGAKIARRRGSPLVERITITEPIEGTGPLDVIAGQFGGTRHLSAAQFIHDQRDALALVASQDGRFTVFAWSPCADQVHAHRVEALLL